MQIQQISVSDYTLSTPKFSPTATPQILTSFSPIRRPSKLGQGLSTNSGFCKSLNRVTKSLLGWRKQGSMWTSVRCGLKGENDDGFYMRRCVEVARKGIGCTSPNPMVGCVIVKDGKIIGEGFHPKAGQPHGEVFALRDAGDLAEHATAYVSLEPCNHFGRTPPCTEALIKAKVKKVVVGMVDPNPIVASKGVNRLRDAGIEVIVGVEEELCKKLNEAYIHYILTGKPFVTVRYSLSVNGHLLDQLGGGVTDSGGYYSQLLQEYDAVIVSSSLLSENLPIPSSQEHGANQPFWVIIPRTPTSSKIPLHSKGVIFTDNETATAPEIAQEGIETVALDQINLNVILEYCERQGFCSVLLDLRGNFGDFEEIIKEGIKKHYFNKIVVELLPLWSECDDGNPLLALRSLERTLEVTNLQPKISGQSAVVEGYLKF